MTRLRILFVFALVLFGTAPTLAAQGTYPYYDKWATKYTPSGKKYYYTHYYYSPGKYHHCYCYPYRNKRYVYYYNWQKKRYWGRYDLEAMGENKYSLLPPGKAKEQLDDIAEIDFPSPKPLSQIAIPASEEGEDPTGKTMTAPPDVPMD